MKKIQKNAARFDNLKQDFLDDKKYSGTAEATLNGYRYDITRFLKFLSDEQLAVNEAGFKRYVIVPVLHRHAGFPAFEPAFDLDRLCGLPSKGSGTPAHRGDLDTVGGRFMFIFRVQRRA